MPRYSAGWLLRLVFGSLALQACGAQSSPMSDRGQQSSGSAANTGGSVGLGAQQGIGGPVNATGGDALRTCTFDPGLKKSIDDALTQQRVASVDQLTQLYVGEYPYESLTGLECLTGLTDLSLAYYFPQGEQPIIDLEPLRELRALRWALLSSAQFSHLDALADTAIRDLTISNAELSSLDGLEALQQLETLSLDLLPAWDLSPLSQLTALRRLALNYGSITNLEILSGHPTLEALQLWSTGVTSLKGLRDLPRLTSLELVNEHSLANFEGLSNVPLLTFVALEGCSGLESLNGLEAAENLTHLEVSWFTSAGPPAELNLTGLDEVDSLESFSAPDSNVVDISPLSSCTRLDSLDVSGNRITDITPLRGLPLTALDISRNPLESWTTVTELSGLTALSIDGLHVDSLEPLVSLALGSLSASDNEITDLSPTSAWTLSSLSVANNAIVDLPDGFVGGSVFTDLSGNALSEAADARVRELCAQGQVVLWNDYSCNNRNPP